MGGRPKVDMVGRRYGRLEVLSFDGSASHDRWWQCRCDCGSICVRRGKVLRRGESRSCGCLDKDRIRVKNLAGRKFGRLLVVRQSGKESGRICWECVCDCGQTTRIRGNSLVSGRIKSCGCIRRETASRTTLSNMKYQVEVGKKFGRLLVTKLAEHRGRDGKRLWECVCDCGGMVTLDSTILGSGNTKSCGCLRSERQRDITRSLRWANIHRGMRHSSETRKKMRLIAIERISKQKFDGMPMVPCIGREEKGCLDQLSEILTHPLRRQYGVNGYFLDGYVEELKLAIEFDEDKHKHPCLRDRDQTRQMEIEGALGCRFFRITSSDWKNPTRVMDEFRKLVSPIDIVGVVV